MGFATILLFFVMTWSFGYSISFFLKRDCSMLERFFLNVGFGLGVVPLLGIILNIVRIQVYWPIFLLLSLVVPAYRIYQTDWKRLESRIKGFRLRFKVSRSVMYFTLALLLSTVFFIVYLKGSFTYPYLEDDDPWHHAVSAKFVKETRTISWDPEIVDGGRYLEPYPPGYAVLQGIMYQTNEQIIWSLKVINVLLISLANVFFYLFAVSFLKDMKKALFATFCMIMIPCFFSHFIWASSLAIALFFPALYAINRIEEDWKWMVPAVIAMAGMIVSQMSNPFIFGVFLGVFVVIRSISHRRFVWKILLAGFLGALIAFSIFWIPAISKFGLDYTMGKNSIQLDELSNLNTATSGGGLLYSWGDMIVAKTVSKMDNPIGIGVFLFFLAAFSVIVILLGWIKHPKKIFSPETDWKVISVVWLIIALMGVHGNRMPFPMLMPHRWWAILAIPIALLAVEGLFALGRLSERAKVPRFFVYAVIIIGILLTSGYPKYAVETSYWPPGVGWGSMDELKGYLTYVAPLPYNTKVFTMCSPDSKVLAFDKLAEPWDIEYYRFKNEAFTLPPGRLNSWLKSRDYGYLVMDSYCVREHSENETVARFDEISRSGMFVPKDAGPGFYLFRVV